MTSPADEHPGPNYPAISQERSSDEEGTIIDNNGPSDSFHLKVNTVSDVENYLGSQKSPSQSRADNSRLDDDLRLLQVERAISEQDGDKTTGPSSVRRERSKRTDDVDEFDVATNPLHERAQLYRPPTHPTSRAGKFLKRVHRSSFLVRYVTYITPVVLILLIPLLIGALVPRVNGGDGPGGTDGASVGGVSLFWFMVWLEIVWLTLWLGRIIALMLPYPAGIIASLFTNNSKKWRDMVKQLELAATLFFWWLAIEISFLPTMIHHQKQWDPDKPATAVQSWQKDTNKVLISFLVLASLNLIEKVIIQLIAISFHQRTYEDRIELNKFQIGSLTKLYTYSKVKLQAEDSDFEAQSPITRPASGTRTPGGLMLEKAQKNTQKAVNQFGDVAGKIAADFTGRAVTKSSHPSQVTLTLLSTTAGSQVLARRLYRTFAREETETVHQEDLTAAFENQDECDAAFTMFDKDMNGDISMEELEAVCVEIGRERKAITASLKDLDSVVSKLDNCFMVVVAIISILVLISLISSAAATGLSSAGSVVLGLSWLFSATATEFLQSLIFVFVKHPYDVGDRVTIYGNTGATLSGDDYFVKEIALLYTEFKKMQGQVVQAPNSYLNTLFILNQRRSGGLAEGVPMVFKFGTTLEQIDGLRNKLLEFVKAEKREYQPNILTELENVVEAHSITLNVVFFYKSNWQNEGLRLQRRNKFICALMVAMQELGIEGPRMRYPGQRESFPLYTQPIPFSANQKGRGGTPDNPEGLHPTAQEEPSFIPFEGGPSRPRNSSSVSRSQARPRGESIAQMSKRLDFSLGMTSLASSQMSGDVYGDRNPRKRIPPSIHSQTRVSQSSRDRKDSRASGHDFARTPSRSATIGPGIVQRTGTEGGRRSGSIHRSSIHRNRFFPRRSHDSDRMESGMAGIPEAETPGTPLPPHIDKRTGLVSSSAMRVSRDDASGRLSTDGSHQYFPTIPFPPPPDPTDMTETQDFEMRKISH